MRICSVDEGGVFGGPERRIIEIANSLKKYNILTHVVYPNQKSKRFTREIKKANISSTSIYLNRLTKEKIILFQFVLFFFYEIFLLYKLFKKEKFDLIQVNGSQQFKGAIAAKLAKRPTIWVLEDTMMDSTVKKICNYLIHHLASGIIVVASSVYDYYINGTELEIKPCIEIPAHVDTKVFDPKKVPMLNNLNFKGKTIITTVAGINPTKGIEYFVEMASLLLKKNRNLLFLIAGAKISSHSRYSEQIKKLIYSKNIQNEIVFLGLIEEIPSLLKSSDIFVCSSISEASPMAVWEAMAMEKCVVTTDVGAVRNYITDGKSGYVVPIKDSKELFNKVNYLLKNTQIIKSMGKQARKVAKQNLDILIAAKKYSYFYKKIILKKV